MRNTIGSGRTAFLVTDLECLYLRYLGISKPHRYRRETYIMTESEKFTISCECDNLIYNLQENEEYFFQIATTLGGNRVIIDVIENQLDHNEK